MRREPKDTLLRELRSAGANSVETAELAGIAIKLGQLKEHPVRARKQSLRLPIPLGIATGAAAILAVVVLAQSVLPGSPLYPLQQASDSVAVFIHPSYRATVMVHRADQVRTLVDNHAPSGRVLATLSDYQSQAKAYRAHYADYEVFEQCKSSLMQADEHAAGQDRLAISRTLASLQDV